MKNSGKGAIGLALCVVLSWLLVVSCSSSTGKATKRSWSKVGRYENKTIGFSVEYDAEKLPRDLPLGGQYLFRRRSSSGDFPVLNISVSPYPQGISLKATAGLIASALPRFLPGSRVHGVANQKMIKLSDRTEANYFEMKWSVEGMELATVFVIARKGDSMITVAGNEKAENSLEDLAAMAKTLKLDLEVDEEAQKSTGFGKDGLFVRTDSPSFTLNYPKEFRNMPLRPNQIFNAGIPQGSPSISITIAPLRTDGNIGGQLRAMADVFASVFKSFGTDIKIVSNESIDNYKAFPAAQFEIVWKFRGQALTTLVHAIAKENKAVLLSGTTMYDNEELLDIFKTINLNP
ncbi:MAG: hypothetical protein GY866_09570 [Proteobacteria bacterium]|nr:hypothetical protein [Pseudomonadota bacterium]